jgi:hypothetical protein
MRTVTAVRMAANEISPKAVLAFLYPFIATVAAVVVTWIVEGTFDENALRVGVAGLIASGLALIGAYLGKPGEVVVDDTER